MRKALANANRRIVRRFKARQRRENEEGLALPKNKWIPPQEISVFQFPYKVRHKIWNSLDPTTVRTMRLVCRQMKDDVDCLYGFHGVLSDKTETFYELTKIRLKSLTIIRLLKKIDNYFLRWPFHLQKLRIDTCIVTAENVYTILLRCSNITDIYLNIWRTESYEDLNFEPSTLADFSNQILKALAGKSELRNLWINLAHEKRSEAFDMISTSTMPHCPLVTTISPKIRRVDLQKFAINFPTATTVAQAEWINYLTSKKYVNSFFCDLGNTYVLGKTWQTCLERIIFNCRNSLTRLDLNNLVNGVFSNDDNGDKGVFDWTLISSCKRLTHLKISAKSNGSNWPFVRRIHHINFEKLESNVELVELDITLMDLTFTNFNSVFFRLPKLSKIALRFCLSNESLGVLLIKLLTSVEEHEQLWPLWGPNNSLEIFSTLIKVISRKKFDMIEIDDFNDLLRYQRMSAECLQQTADWFSYQYTIWSQTYETYMVDYIRLVKI